MRITKEYDPLRFEDFRRSELAIDIISTMLGINLKDTMYEEAKSNPDPLKISEYKEQENILLSEQNSIYLGNKEIIRACINKYSPLIRARYDVG